VAARRVGVGQIALPDAGSLDDPLVRCLDASFSEAANEFSVTDAVRGQRAASADNF
jgi:hypothetical protein